VLVLMMGGIYEVHLEMVSGGIICIPSLMTNSVLLFFQNEGSRLITLSQLAGMTNMSSQLVFLINLMNLQFK
jgi:hypothetical protein